MGQKLKKKKMNQTFTKKLSNFCYFFITSLTRSLKLSLFHLSLEGTKNRPTKYKQTLQCINCFSLGAESVKVYTTFLPKLLARLKNPKLFDNLFRYELTKFWLHQIIFLFDIQQRGSNTNQIPPVFSNLIGKTRPVAAPWTPKLVVVTLQTQFI